MSTEGAIHHSAQQTIEAYREFFGKADEALGSTSFKQGDQGFRYTLGRI